MFRWYSGADPGGGRWGGRPPLGRRDTIKDTPFNNVIELVLECSFKHQFITGRPPLEEILYPPLVVCTIYSNPGLYGVSTSEPYLQTDRRVTSAHLPDRAR